MESMPSTQRAKIKVAAQTYLASKGKRWWVQRDDFETARGAVPKGQSEKVYEDGDMV
jgi:hypothetical protein